MKKIAITGGIATGKSLVEKLFSEIGAATLDTDEVVHNLLDSNKDVISRIQELFSDYGIEITDETGRIDRKKVGKIVFSDKQKLIELENIIHPEVKRVVETFFVDNEDKEVVVVSVPLLFETGMEKMFDYVIAVTANDEIRQERLVRDRNMTREDALKRMSAQTFGQDKLEKADFIIENNNSAGDIRTKVEEIFRNIRAR
jgi:dephospho-CoA kinase